MHRFSWRFRAQPSIVFIYSFDELPIRAVAYAALAHVQLTRQFLAHPDRFLQQLFADEE